VKCCVFFEVSNAFINIILDDVRFQVLTAASMKFRVFSDALPCSQVDVTDFSEVRTASIIRAMMEPVRTSET
jgi:hypothetical protein